MSYLTWTTPVWLIALLGSSACAPVSGDFCDVVTSPIEFDSVTASQVVKTDRGEAEQIAAQNKYWAEHCQ